MTTISNPASVLADPEVKKYFLCILNGDLPEAEKYNKFIEFFEISGQIHRKLYNYPDYKTAVDQSEVNRLVSAACQEMGYWKPKEILEQTADSIKRAVRRLKNSQHKDGGWGGQVEQSDFWGTSYAVLCLNSVMGQEGFSVDVDIDRLLNDGLHWLLKNPHTWFVDHMPPDSNISTYDASIAARCLAHARKRKFPGHLPGNGKMSPGKALSIEMKKLRGSQNDDGGWDARIWGPAIATLTKVYSEVGATSMALQALAEVNGKPTGIDIEKAFQWLVRTQNQGGSWNDGSCRPGSPAYRLTGNPTINKTCDALQGIIAAQKLGADAEPFKQQISKAVNWLQDQEQPILDRQKNIKGWGWDFSEIIYENTCLTLETLVKMSDASLPLLTSNAHWLMSNQEKADGSIQDGNWKYGHTARIALSLVEYYNTIKKSALFEEKNEGQTILSNAGSNNTNMEHRSGSTKRKNHWQVRRNTRGQTDTRSNDRDI